MENKEKSLEEKIAVRPISKYADALMPAYHDIEEQTYLHTLADSLSMSKKKNYAVSRNIVLDVHLKLERLINFCIMDCCFKGAFLYGFKPGVGALIDAIFDIDFFKKINLMRGLAICKSSSIEMLVKINNLRNAFAHGYREGHKKYNYHGDSIFEAKTIKKLIADFNEIRKEMLEGKIFREVKDE